MTAAEYSSDDPSVGSLVPDDQEFRFAKAFCRLEIAKFLVPFFNSAKPLDGIDLKTSRHQFPAETAADISPRLVDVVFPRPADASAVVMELDIGVQERSMPLQLARRVAMVESIEEFRIQIRDGAIKSTLAA